jgi:hypothetical protein
VYDVIRTPFGIRHPKKRFGESAQILSYSKLAVFSTEYNRHLPDLRTVYVQYIQHSNRIYILYDVHERFPSYVEIYVKHTEERRAWMCSGEREGHFNCGL